MSGMKWVVRLVVAAGAFVAARTLRRRTRTTTPGRPTRAERKAARKAAVARRQAK